jgi:TldD protein
VLPARYELDALSIDQPGADKRALLERASKAAHAFDGSIIKAEASFSEEVREVLLATSDGRVAFDVQPMFRFGVRAIAERAGKRQEGSSGGGGRMSLAYFDEAAPEAHARLAAKQAVTMLDAREAPAGEIMVVLAPGDSGILLHEAVGHGLEADFNRKGTSNYSGQMGNEVASSLCTVVDDATLVESRGAINVDDEGNDPGRRVLIEGGRLVGYMHDRISAKHYGLAPTGNGRRESFSCSPMPRMTNTILLAGPHEPDEILRSVKKGIFAKKFGGGQVDIGNGDFVFSLTESYLIEDGKLSAPLKGVNLIGNGPDVLRHVSMLGSDLELSDGIWTCGKDGQSVPVGVGCPTIRIDRITVGGTRVSRVDPAAGFDDFTLVPFVPSELYMRIRCLEWRRSEFANEERLKIGTMVIDRSAREVHVEGRPITLTTKEFSLLAYLSENRGRVKSREQLLARVWGASYEGGPRTVDIHVRRLRAKLGNAFPLQTVRGAGYKLPLDPSVASAHE